MSPLVNEDLTLGVIYGPREDNPFEKSGIALGFFFNSFLCEVLLLDIVYFFIFMSHWF
jgi:hypothetical protein